MNSQHASKTAAVAACQEVQHAAVPYASQSVLRPAVAQAVQDANFAVEDEALTHFAEQLVSGCWCASVPGLPGQPLAAISPALEQLAGQAAAGLLGCSSQKLQQAFRLEPQVADELAAARAAGDAALVELSACVKNGKKSRFAVCFVPLALSSGAIPLLLEFWLNMDEEWADAVEKTGVRQLASQVSRATEAVVISDAGQQGTANITACSIGAASLTGYSQLELAGCSVQALAGPETSSSSMRHLLAAQLNVRHASMKVLLYRRNGSPFWAMAASCPLVTWKQGAAPVLTTAAGPRQQQQQQQLARSSVSADCSSSGGNSNGSTSVTAQLLLLIDITCSSHAQRVGKYTLGRVLGAGASGVVRIGKNTATDELVAVKSIDATRFHSISEIEQVQAEMAVLAQMRHPSIIRLHEVVFSSGCFYFVMEYASGGSLARHMAEQPGGRLSEAAVQELFGGILSALEYCHKRRVIHRDLKPENILMEGGTPKIADFGLAGVVAPFNGSGFKLQCGTPEFTAPEIVVGAEYEGTAVDLWSVGVMLYEALSGQLPFHGSSQSALFRSIRRGAYPPLPKGVSAAARDLVKRLLTVDPAARITWEQLSRHPWLGRQAEQQQRQCTSSCIGAACKGNAAGYGSVAVLQADARQSSDAHEMRFSSSGQLTDDVLAIGAAQPDSSSIAGGVQQGCRWSLQSHVARSSAAGQRPDSSCGLQLPQRSALSFTSAGCHDSVRVVMPESRGADDPIAAAIKRLAECTTMSSPQSDEEPRHVLKDSAPASPAKTNSSKSTSSRGQAGSCLASPKQVGRRDKGH